MKKILAGILALTLSLGLMGCNDNNPAKSPEETFADLSDITTTEETKAETTVTEETTTEEAYDVKAVADKFAKTLVSGKYTINCYEDKGDEKIAMIMSVDLKNNRVHILPLVPEEKISSILINNDGLYIFDDVKKQYLVMNINSENLLGEYAFYGDISSFDLPDSETKSGKLNGEECSLEHYYLSESSSLEIFVRDGKVVAMMNVTDSNIVSTYMINDYSDSVDESVFEIPEGYTNISAEE